MVTKKHDNLTIKNINLIFSTMPKHVIERDIPSAGNMSQDQLKGISQTSCKSIAKSGQKSIA